MADLHEKLEKYQEPVNWQETKEWLDTLSEEKSWGRVANALLTKKNDQKFVVHRLGTFGLMIFSKSWDKLSNYFDNSQRAEQIVGLLNTTKSSDESRAIRIVDTLFDSMASNIQLTGIKEILSWHPTRESEYQGSFSDNDWSSLINELSRSDSIFLTDSEMEKLNKSPRSNDSSQRPSRFNVASLWSGRSGVEETKGDLSKSIQYCKENYLK